MPRQDWRPRTVILQDGDEVGLFNHSYWAGSVFRRYDYPPRFAPYAFKKSSDSTIRVWKMQPPSLNKYFDVMKVSETDRILQIEQDPSWSFLKGGNAVSDLLVRADRSAPPWSTKPGSDNMALFNLREYYNPGVLQSRGYAEFDEQKRTLKANLAKNLLWAKSASAAASQQDRPLTLEDYDVGMDAYRTSMNLQSIEPLRLIIRFVS